MSKEEITQPLHTGRDINPIKLERKCTDVMFLLLFFAFLVGEVTISSYGYANGNPHELIGARDKNGDLCGADRDGDNLFIPLRQDYILSEWVTAVDILNTGICVSECPDATIDEADPISANLTNTLLEAYNNGTGGDTLIRDIIGTAAAQKIICDYDTNPLEATLNDLDKSLLTGEIELLDDAKCWIPYPTSSVFWRCVPYVEESGWSISVLFFDADSHSYTDIGFPDVLSGLTNDVDLLNSYIKEIMDNYEVFFLVGGLALFGGFVYAFCMRLFAFVLVWLIVLLSPVGLIMITVFCWIKANELDPNSVPGLEGEFPDDTDTSSDNNETNQKIFHYLAIIFTVITVLFCLILIFMIKRINVAIKVIKMGARAVVALPSMVLAPFASMIFDFCYFAWWIWTMLYLMTCGEYDDEAKEWNYNEDMKRALIYHLLALFWGIAFIDALVQLTLALSVSSWYFCRASPDYPNFPIAFSAKTILRYHIGTAAFGSLILAIVQTIRAILNYLMARVEAAGKSNDVVKLIHYCIDCCMRCFERFIKYINENAYVQTAVYGTNFCTSVSNGVSLLLANIGRVAAFEYAGHFILFLGKLVVALMSTAGGMYLLTDGDLSSDGAGVNPLAMGLMFVIGWAIGTLFMSVYEIAMDTVFQCYCIDDSKSSKDVKEYFDEQDREHAKSISEGKKGAYELH